MELSMKDICVGVKTKNDVVHESIEQYREVFITASQQIDVLKNVSHPQQVFERSLIR